MAQRLEDVTIWTIASLSKYFAGYSFGIPVVFMQQTLEKIDPTKDRLEILYEGPNFSRAGSKNEILGQIGVKVLVHTTLSLTDIYYHHRIKARITDALNKSIKLLRVGVEGADGIVMGFLRPVPTETLRITPVSVEEPDASIVEQVYNIELC